MSGVMVFAACSREPAPQPPTPQVVVVSPPTAATPPSAAAPASASAAAITMTGAKPGEPITLRGRPSKLVWQHMMTSVPGKRSAYFDLGGGKEQTVVYWKEPPNCAGDIEVTGKVLELRGPSKRPGQPETKVDDTYSERHVDVDTARCADVAR
jgi:hypothetical protein